MPAERPARRKILCIHRHGPYGTVYGQEGLEVAMITGAFDHRVAMALIDDGVFLLRRGQDTEGLGMKRFTAGFRAAGDFGVYRVYVERDSLQARGMNAEALMSVPQDSDSGRGNLVEVVSAEALSTIIAEQDVLLNF